MLASIVTWLALAVLLVALALGLRHRRPVTLLAIFSVALTVGAGELALRLLYPPSWRPRRMTPSRVYHHIDRPRSVLYGGRVDGKYVIVRTNEDGLRTDHNRAEFVSHRERIAVLGDSFTFGSGVRQEFAFPQVMEKLWRTGPGHDDIAVLNAGIISYSPMLAQRLFDGIVVHYKPTRVLYVLDATDIGDDYNYENELEGQGAESHFDWQGVRVTPYFGAVGQIIHLEDALDNLALPLAPLLRWAGRGSISNRDYGWYYFRASIGGRTEYNRFFIYRHPLAETRPYFDRTYRYICALAESVRRSGAEFTLILAPRFHHWNPKECPANWESESYALDEPYQFEYFRYFDERRAEAPFAIYDLLPSFQATQEFPLVFRRDPHWNEAGHAFVARTLATYLEGRGKAGADGRATPGRSPSPQEIEGVRP